MEAQTARFRGRCRTRRSESDRARAQSSECWIKVGRVVALAIVSFAAESTAGAQDTKARAQELFQQGVEAMDKGDEATGCAHLRENLELFAAPNTLFTITTALRATFAPSPSP